MSENSRGHPEEPVFECNSYVANVSNVFPGGFDILSMYSPETILNIVKYPMENATELREISRALYSSNGVVTNAVDYCVALPTLSRVVIPYGKTQSTKNRYKEKTYAVLDAIRDREFVRNGIFNTLIEGEYFAYMETKKRPLSKATSMNDSEVQFIKEINETDYNVDIVHLDPDYTRVIGIKNGSYVIAFDLNYFTMGDMEPVENKLRKYPEEIRKGYEKYKSGKGGQWLVLDNNHTIAVKFRAKKNEPHGRPMILAAIDDILYNSRYTKAKRKALEDSNTRIYYQTFPEGKNKGEAALTKAQQEQQHETVRNGLTANSARGSTTVFSVAAGTKIDALKPDIAILSDNNDTTLKNNIATSLGFAGSLLSGEGTSSFSAQTNNLELVTAEVFHIIELITYELNKCINACVIKNKSYRTEVQYLPITYTNRKEFASMAKELYLQGKGPLSLWASAVGISPEAFYSMLDEELAADIENKYPVHKTSYTQSADDEVGRPVDEDTTNESTMYARANNTNDMPKPSAG